eukprot:TRINITY_DN4150_c0_g1_i1.p1 TRINITY_DN4150_c0_g1~~TRINITY_DN4150_c0_g1_i1.p1  ORF type:complete len:353 (-),score=91.60 TRINITY_DN4150_c0_g1_i1:81-1139(-)
MAAEAAPAVPIPAEAAPAAPEKSNRVFVRGFDFGTTEEQVKAHCAAAGQVVSCEKQSNNAMILTYSTQEEAEKAAATFNQTVIEGNTRYIDVKLDEGKERGGKQRKPKEDGPSGPDLPRQRITEAPIAATVLRFMGNTGWIKPSEPVEHPEFGRHKGKIYVHKKDLQGVESLQRDSSIVCHLYVDGAGLGAEEVTVVALPPSPPADAEKKASVKGPPPESPPPAAPGTVTEGAKPGEGKEAAEAQAKSSSKKKKKKKNKAKGKNGPNGPNLSRTRIGESPISGTVLRFVGNTGWIKPSENVDHPEFGKHKGKVYVHKKDLQGLESLDKDMNVVFHLYADAAGLGAEEVTLAL